MELDTFPILKMTGGGTFNRDLLIGRWSVLYFYPRDNTPGCTREGQAFRDLSPAFTEAGAQILGVSRDGLAAHERFKEKQQFPFPLVSDPDEALCILFDVIKDKKLYGKAYRGIERSTFLLDPEVNVARQWRNVKVPGHAEAVLQALQELNAP